MAETLSFKSHYRVETLAPDKVFLFCESGNVYLKGVPYYLLAPFLHKGGLSADQMVDQVDHAIAPSALYYALECLKKAGYLDLEEPILSPEQSAFCHFLPVSPKQAEERLRASRVFVAAFGNIDKTALIDQLKALQINVVDSLEESHFKLFLVDDYLNGQLRLHSPMLLVKPVGKEVWIGPLFDSTICWRCFINRIKTNRLEESYLLNRRGVSGGIPVAIASLASTLQTAYAITASEIFKWIVTQSSSLSQKLITFDAIKLILQEHQITSHCCTCHKSAMQELTPVTFTPRPDYRSFSPEYTIDKFSKHVSPITGIIQSLTSFEKNNSNCLHTYQSGHNFALPSFSEELNFHKFRQFTSGKGATDSQAKASSIGEALERYCGIFQGNEYRIQGSYRHLREKAIHPSECMLFSDKQYQNRKEWNVGNSFLHQIPLPFSEEATIDWSPLWSLKDQCHKFLPTSYCYYMFGNAIDTTYCMADSNGCAAGHFLEEALLQGLFEVVERDCVAIWWYNRLLLPCVDYLSFEDAYFDALTREYERQGKEIWVIDITNDLLIPTFVALSKKKKGESEILFGFGTHSNAQIAIRRALTEMNQMIEFFTAHKNSIQNGYALDVEDKVMVRWMERGTLPHFPFLGGNRQSTKSKRDYFGDGSTDLWADIQKCQKTIEKAGMEIFILNQSRPEVDLKVVKVVVPGLRHFWPRLAPGRLYNVPVQLKWIPKPLQEEQLNPIPIFI